MNYATVSSQGRFHLQAVPVRACYWHAEQLDAFTLQMSAHGLCISASMMLGDRAYAREQLRCAHTLDDELLRALAREMWDFFRAEAPGRSGAEALAH